MLVVTQRAGETVKIGEYGDISVTILGISGNQVRVGYHAAKEIPIHREKIFNRIQAEKESEK